MIDQHRSHELALKGSGGFWDTERVSYEFVCMAMFV